MQAKITDLESQVSEAVRSDTTRTGDALQSQDIFSPIPKAVEGTTDSSSVTKKLEEELKKRDALIEVLLPLTLIRVRALWLNHGYLH